MKSWNDPEVRLAAEYNPERIIQRHAVLGLTQLGFWVCDMSQGRETQQQPGIPDLYMVHSDWGVIGWCEIKQPVLYEEGTLQPYVVRKLVDFKTGKTTRCDQGKRTYEQEDWQRRHRALHQPAIHCYTVDSADQAIAYWAWAGYPVPKDLYRYPYEPNHDVRFVNPNAKPREATSRSTGRKQPQRIHRGRKLF